MVNCINNAYKEGQTQVKKDLWRNLFFGFLYLASFFSFIILCLPQIEILLKVMAYRSVLPNYKNTANYMTLLIGFMLAIIFSCVAKINLTEKNIFNVEQAQKQSKQYMNTWLILIIIFMLIELLGFAIVYFLNFLVSLIHFTWVDHETLAYIAINLLGAAIWICLHVFAEMILPVAMNKTFGVKQTLKYCFKWYKKIVLLMIGLFIRFLLWDLLVFFTGYFADIYVYPLKLASIIALVNERTKE